MISVSGKSLKNITKIVVIGVFTYSLLYLASTLKEYYETYKEKERLTIELQVRKDETLAVKEKINKTKEDIQKVENSYLKQDELANKVTEIFKRVSLLDYQIDYMDSKKICIDRYVLITKVNYESENGKQAIEGILNFIGETVQSEGNDKLYFVDYIAQPKDLK